MTLISFYLNPAVQAGTGVQDRGEEDGRGTQRWGESERKRAVPTHKPQTENASSPGNVCFEEVLQAACK